MESNHTGSDPEQQKYGEVENARRRLEELVDSTNQKAGSPGVDQVAWNTSVRQSFIDGDGEKSIYNLLPPTYKHFAIIRNILNRQNIFTKKDLIDKDPQKLEKERLIGPKRKEFIFAMRDLAIAESNAKVSRQA